MGTNIRLGLGFGYIRSGLRNNDNDTWARFSLSLIDYFPVIMDRPWNDEFRNWQLRLLRHWAIAAVSTRSSKAAATTAGTKARAAAEARMTAWTTAGTTARTTAWSHASANKATDKAAAASSSTKASSKVGLNGSSLLSSSHIEAKTLSTTVGAVSAVGWNLLPEVLLLFLGLLILRLLLLYPRPS